MRELHLTRDRRLAWHERDGPTLQDPGDAIVRPIVAGRCDGDTLPLHRRGFSRAMQAGLRLGAIDPVVGSICGPVPFRGPYAIGHECVAEIIAVGNDVHHVRIGQIVVVPWAVSCGTCERCRRGLTAKCTTTTGSTLAAFGFGPACGPWGGMVADQFRVPHADHMLVPVPTGIPPLRVAAASDNLADAWRAVVPQLAEREGGSVLVLGGGAKSIGLYAAGLAVAHGASVVDFVDRSAERRRIAESFGARAHPHNRRPHQPAGYDIVVEATSSTSGLQRAVRAVAPGGICTAVGWYLATATPVPLMHMYATDVTLHVGVSHTRADLPDLLDFVQRTGFPAERVTTLTADWDDAPAHYGARTTKVVLQRERITAEEP